MSTLLRGGGHIVFGADPIGIGIDIDFDVSVNQRLDSYQIFMDI